MAWLPFAKLEITDGTDTINLLNLQSSGFCITGWEPAIQDLKAGGTWANPPTADERELIVSQLANVEEQYTFDVSAASPDELIGKLRDLRAMLEKGRQYVPTEWQDTPVDIVAQGYGDSNERYARIKNWRTPNDGFPYGPPMWDTIEGTAIEDFQIIIERGAWQENRSGVGTATEISAVETYDGRNLGNVDSAGTRDPTTAREVYIATKRNEANLTDVYVDNGGVFGPNLMDAALPYNLLPAVPAVNDAIYFGIDTTIADSGPFDSLVFDIGTAGVGYTGDWEYWNGAVWFPFTAAQRSDNTDSAGFPNYVPFGIAGVNSVHFVVQTNWAITTVNGITGYWIRMIVLTTPGPLTAPTQQNRDIYSIIWPYIEVQTDEIKGGLPALFNLLMYSESLTAFPTGLFHNRFIFGSRTYNRGANFTAYVNLAQEQNPSGITLSAAGGSSFVADVQSPSGVALSMPVNVASFSTRGSVQFAASIAPSFYGKYHIFLRGFQTGGTAGSIQLRMTGSTDATAVSENYFTSSEGTFSAIGVLQLVDLGAITFQPQTGLPTTEAFQQLFFDIEVNGGGAGQSADLYDWILIPIDEYAGDYEIQGTNAGVLGTEYLDLDAVSFPKLNTTAFSKDKATDNLTDISLRIQNEPPILQANARQRIWFVGTGTTGGTPDLDSNPTTAFSIQLFKQQRYWSMRGLE